MERVIIAAVAENGVIGNDGGIPWHYPEDFKHFRETTTGHPVIMGRTTYESLPDPYRPLPDRTNIVLSREALDVEEDVVNVHSIDAALEAGEDTGDTDVYIAGGASVYEQFLEQDLVDRMLITWIPGEPDGDTYFPEWDRDDWDTVDEHDLGDEGLRVVDYRRTRDQSS